MIRHSLAAAVAAAAVAVVVVGGSTSARADVVNYDFTSLSGSATPQTLDGATFSSPSDPGAFTFGPNAGLYSMLSATVLSSAGVPASLAISFAIPVSSISFDFALGDFFGFGGGDTLTFTPNVGTADTVSAGLPGSDFYPEALLDYSGPAFTSGTLTSTYAIAIGNLQTVPEPASLALLGTALLGLGVFRRRA